MKDLHVKILSFILIILGLFIFIYKAWVLNFPIIPDKKVEIWTIETRISVQALPGPTKMNFYIPKELYNYSIVDESFVSGNYGLSVEDEGPNRVVSWAIRKSKGENVLYYRLQIIRDNKKQAAKSKEENFYQEKPDYTDLEATAITALLDSVRSSSADVTSFTIELIKRLNNENPDENVSILIKDIKPGKEWVNIIKYTLAGAHIPSRIIYLLKLKEGVRHAELIPWLEVYNGSDWTALNPRTGEKGIPSQMIIWSFGKDKLISASDGIKINDISFSVGRSFEKLIQISNQRAKKLKSPLIEYSLLSLPLDIQNIYRVLLFLPLGIIAVVFFRNIIGVETFGTFMPILIALAFRETQLIWGIALFSLIVTLGLMIRFYLERLKLLLVPRLSSILIIVIILMMFISILSYKLGAERPLSVALFPMVIIAMVIERMSIAWEETGPIDVFKRGLGSLLVAAIGYMLMQNPLLNHLIFVFPELLFLILGMLLLVGRYSGYRLTEIWRFKQILT